MKSTTLPGILLLVSLLIGCGSDNDSGSSATQQNTASTDAQTDPAATAKNAMTLRHRFTKGQRMDYLETMSAANKYPMLNQETSFEMETTFHVIVDIVEEDGSASMTWTNDRMKMKLQGTGGTVLFDSADGEEPDHPQWQQLRGVFFPIQYVQFTFHVTTDGIISDVKLSEAAAARLEKDPTLAFVFSQSSLQENPRKLFHLLPAKPVKPADTWNHVISSEAMPGAKIEIELTNTYQGLENVDGQQLALLKQTRKTKTKFGPESFFTQTYKDDLTSGSEWFDPKIGWFVKTDDTMVMTTVTKQLGTSIEAEQTIKMGLRLVPPPKPDPDSENTTEATKPTTL